MALSYRKLAALALLVFAASQVIILIELTHDRDRTGQLFVSVIFGVSIVLAAVVHQLDRWWAVAVAFAAALLGLLSESAYVSHVTNFDEAWEFAPISLSLAGLIPLIIFAGADLVRRRQHRSLDAPAFAAPAYGAAIAALSTLIAVSFVVTLSTADSVSASERAGATVVRMKEVKFAPKELTANAGDQVRLVIENDDLGSHTFVLKAPGADVDEYFGAGDDRLVTFTLSEPGTYTFKCDIEGHTKMKGTIVVH
jgi:plastocyanin